MTDTHQTNDLLLRPSNVEFAESLLAYYVRNQAFLQSFEPQREPAFYTYENQYAQLRNETREAANKASFRFYISAKGDADTIIGCVGLNNVVWGCFLSCFLGYKLDGGYVNRGYMTQAVQAVADFAFSNLRLHRIEANVMPHNRASHRVLEKCGFVSEGLSKKYLKINGRWEDHIHMVLINENL